MSHIIFRTGTTGDFVPRTDALAAAQDLLDLFLQQCARCATAVAYVVLAEDLSVAEQLSFAQLEQEARALACALRSRCTAGDRVVLAFDNGLDSIQMFWACILAGVVPVPAPAPRQASEADRRRIEGIATDSGAALIVSVLEHRAAFGHLTVPWTSPAALAATRAPHLPPPPVSKQDLAYLQYTSGSTSEPRGVELTHHNVMAHCAMLKRAMEKAGAPTRILSWLPWFHDFGLLQGVISPVYLGITSYLMPTAVFLRRPLGWLDAISRYRITNSGAPDAGYLACVNAMSRKSGGWTGDLSSWLLATSGGEPVRAETVTRFVEAFAPHGFRAESLAPAYGMAEAVLALSMKPAGERARIVDLDRAALDLDEVREAPPGGARSSRSLVASGAFLDGIDVRIVDPELRAEVGPNRVGEIWVRGASIGRGYWGKPQLSAETFAAELRDDAVPEHRYLRTGDLGFVRDGQIFISGRLKDIIVVNGRNLYPQDIECAAVNASPMVRASGVIAFGIEGSEGEAVVLLAECSGRVEAEAARAFCEQIRSAVGAEFGIEVADVVLLRRGALPQTSSGKPRRAAAKRAYLCGDYAAGVSISAPRKREAQPAPKDAIDDIVRDAWRSLLDDGRADVDTDNDFFSLGGNSLIAAQLVSRIRAALGVDLPVRAVFEASTLSALAQKVREALPAREAGARPSSSPVRRQGDGITGPLSFTQERLWFVSQQVPESSALNMSLALRLKGRIDVEALEAAFSALPERHELLRTTFRMTADGVEARVHPHMPIGLRRIRLEDDAGPRDAGQRLEDRLALLAQEPFALDRGPLLRACFVAIGPDEGVLLVVMHHMIGDQWSFALLMREVADLYRVRLGEAAGPRPAPALQYADFAAWQRHARDDDRLRHDAAYWLKKLDGIEPAVIPSDFPRSGRLLYRGAHVRVPLDPKLLARLTALGARHGASLSMVLMAALDVLLHRFTGRHDISIGVVSAGRSESWSEALIGPLVNLLVLRTEVDRALSFSTLLRSVRRDALDAFAHQEMPFDRLVSKLKHQRDVSRAPLFQVLFNVLNAPIAKPDFGGPELSLVDFDRGATQFDLSLIVDAVHDLAIRFEYAVQVFQRDTIERLATHYIRLLEDVVQADDRPISALAPMPTAEAGGVLELGRGAQRPLPAETVSEWLKPAFARWTDKSAVVFGDDARSYREIDEASSVVAKALNARGIGRGSKVGLAMARSADMIVAQIGILRSGAAYVPLDLANPPQRLDFISRDCGLEAILVASSAEPARSWGGTVERIGVRELLAGFAAGRTCQDAEPSGLEARPDDPAYVIYTSGSTGEPKGVAVSHRSLVNVLSSLAVEPGLQSSDRMLALTTLSFDISTVETLLPLAVGASVVVADRDAAVDGEALHRMIERYRISVMQAVPSTWHLLIKAGWSGSPSLRKILVGGETLPQNLAVDLVERCGEVWNLYGPTETTVWSTAGRVERPHGRPVSIGRPIANTQVHVLDADLRPCPIGVEGDVYIGGAGVSLGYVNLPDLTAERFLPDPFAAPRSGQQGGEYGARIYRTGDRARWLNDGTLMHLGRTDSQIKLRGYRIELGEIEAMLARHPDVARAVVAPREIAPGDTRLVAYVVARNGAFSADVVRSHLSRMLPDYMLPHPIVGVAELPLLANGKVDFGRLGEIRLEAPMSPRRTVAPRTAEEKAVWAIWRDVLGFEGFGVEDNFFDVGGYSLLALKVVNRVQSEVSPACTVAMLFQHPTVADLVSALRAGGANVEAPLIVSLQELGETPPLFCICGIHLYQELANHLAPHRQVYALFVPSELGLINRQVDEKSLSVERIAADYVHEIRKKQPKGPYYVAGLSFGGLLAFEIAQQLRRAGEEVAFLAMFDTMMPSGLPELALRRLLWHVRNLRKDSVAWLSGRGRSGRQQAAMTAEDWALADEKRQVALRDRIYFRAARRYKPRLYDRPAILMRAMDSKIPDTTRIWARFVAGLEVLSVPGDHLGLLKAPHVEVVARHILNRLGRAACAKPARVEEKV